MYHIIRIVRYWWGSSRHWWGQQGTGQVHICVGPHQMSILLGVVQLRCSTVVYPVCMADITISHIMFKKKKIHSIPAQHRPQPTKSNKLHFIDSTTHPIDEPEDHSIDLNIQNYNSISRLHCNSVNRTASSVIHTAQPHSNTSKTIGSIKSDLSQLKQLYNNDNIVHQNPITDSVSHTIDDNATDNILSVTDDTVIDLTDDNNTIEYNSQQKQTILYAKKLRQSQLLDVDIHDNTEYISLADTKKSVLNQLRLHHDNVDGDGDGRLADDINQELDELIELDELDQFDRIQIQRNKTKSNVNYDDDDDMFKQKSLLTNEQILYNINHRINLYQLNTERLVNVNNNLLEKIEQVQMSIQNAEKRIDHLNTDYIRLQQYQLQFDQLLIHHNDKLTDLIEANNESIQLTRQQYQYVHSSIELHISDIMNKCMNNMTDGMDTVDTDEFGRIVPSNNTLEIYNRAQLRQSLPSGDIHDLYNINGLAIHYKSQYTDKFTQFMNDYNNAFHSIDYDLTELLQYLSQFKQQYTAKYNDVFDIDTLTRLLEPYVLYESITMSLHNNYDYVHADWLIRLYQFDRQLGVSIVNRYIVKYCTRWIDAEQIYYNVNVTNTYNIYSSINELYQLNNTIDMISLVQSIYTQYEYMIQSYDKIYCMTKHNFDSTQTTNLPYFIELYQLNILVSTTQSIDQWDYNRWLYFYAINLIQHLYKYDHTLFNSLSIQCITKYILPLYMNFLFHLQSVQVTQLIYKQLQYESVLWSQHMLQSLNDSIIRLCNNKGLTHVYNALKQIDWTNDTTNININELIKQQFNQ